MLEMTPNLVEHLRGQAKNVEEDGWINAARHMREAADLIEQLAAQGVITKMVPRA